jgi:hypothetical protein
MHARNQQADISIKETYLSYSIFSVGVMVKLFAVSKASRYATPACQIYQYRYIMSKNWEVLDRDREEEDKASKC